MNGIRDIFNSDIIKKALIWVIPIAGLALWLRFDIYYSSAQTLESAFLYAGSLLLDGSETPEALRATASDFPAFILGAAERVGGLFGARALTTILGLATVFFVYKFAREFGGNQAAAFFAALFFAISPNGAFLGKFAANDAIALFFFSGFLWSATAVANYDKNRRFLSATAAALLSLAVLSKFVLGAFIPFAVAASIFYTKNIGKSPVTIFNIIVVCAALVLFGSSGLSFGEIFSANPAGFETSGSGLRDATMTWLQYSLFSIVLFIAFMQVRYKSSASPRAAWALGGLSLVMFVASLFFAKSCPAFQIAVYTQIFLAPAAGLAIFDFLNTDKLHKYSVIAIFGAQAAFSFYFVGQMEKAYPDASLAVVQAHSALNQGSLVLSEDPYLAKYHFYPSLKRSNFYDAGAEDFQYLLNMVENAEFDAIILDGIHRPERYRAIRNAALKRGYKVGAATPYRLSGVMYPAREGYVETFAKPVR